MLVPTSSSTMHSETMALLMRQVALLSESCVVRIGAMAKRVFEPLQCEAHQCTVCRRAAKRVAARATGVDHAVVVRAQRLGAACCCASFGFGLLLSAVPLHAPASLDAQAGSQCVLWRHLVHLLHGMCDRRAPSCESRYQLTTPTQIMF